MLGQIGDVKESQRTVVDVVLATSKYALKVAGRFVFWLLRAHERAVLVGTFDAPFEGAGVFGRGSTMFSEGGVGDVGAVLGV